eukprot:TRINITY_DN31097_c0_g1_i1.p1 TRINITY_DN31097_c0_g1~~TRINITY_DN31097_c0_g1_i1.p1  ORF type:complete len:880 (-),score=138.48 TRINITY_DN31097_c0_g1_i1:287-2926(-)
MSGPLDTAVHESTSTSAPKHDTQAEEVGRDKSHLFVFTGVTANKAGMGADKELVSKFVYERCKNSRYTQRQEDLDTKQRARSEATAADLRAVEARMTHSERLSEERRAKAVLDGLEAKRDLSRTYCVVDMDMFYAAVELRDRPELASKPVAVGGMSMICTANYVARLYGVRSAMPGFIAAEMVRCPQKVGSKMPPAELIFLPLDFAKYTRVANETREIFREYDPEFRAMSLDEAYLDLTSYLSSRGGPETAPSVVEEMRRRVKERTGGLTCSAGIAANPMLAKVCSDDNKPDGQTCIPATRDAILTYSQELPLRRVGGVGKVLERHLKIVLGVVTCGDLLAAAAPMFRAFADKPKTKDFLARVALSLSGGEVAEEEGETIGSVERKSLSCERTFAPDADSDSLRSRLKDLCRQVAEDMSSHVPPLAAKQVSLKLKSSSFDMRNKQANCSHYIGFPPSFGIDGSLPRKRGALGPGSSWSTAVVGFDGTADTGVAAQDLGNDFVAEDAANEAELSRVANELLALLQPHLEAEMPCELRLMGVRVASFRDARATLERGQQRLGRFFHGDKNSVGHNKFVMNSQNGAPTPIRHLLAATAPTHDAVTDSESAVCKDGVNVAASHSIANIDTPHPALANAIDTDTSAAGGTAASDEYSAPSTLAGTTIAQTATAPPEASDRCESRMFVAVDSERLCARPDVIDVVDASEDEHCADEECLVVNDSEFAGRKGVAKPLNDGFTSCPVCGLRVRLCEADRHVNDHYDDSQEIHRPLGDQMTALGGQGKRSVTEMLVPQKSSACCLGDTSPPPRRRKYDIDARSSGISTTASITADSAACIQGGDAMVASATIGLASKSKIGGKCGSVGNLLSWKTRPQAPLPMPPSSP